MFMSFFRFEKTQRNDTQTAGAACFAQDLPALTRHEEHDWTDVDCVFCCLPHATTQEIILQLPEHLKAREKRTPGRVGGWEGGRVGGREGGKEGSSNG